MVIEFMEFLQILDVPQAQLLTSGNRHRSVVNRHNKLRRIRVVNRNQKPTVGAFTQLARREKNLIAFVCQGHNNEIRTVTVGFVQPQPQCDQYMGETLAQVTYPYR